MKKVKKIKCSSNTKAVAIDDMLFQIFVDRARVGGYVICEMSDKKFVVYQKIAALDGIELVADGGIMGKNKLTGEDQPYKNTFKSWGGVTSDDDGHYVNDWRETKDLPKLTSAEIARLDAIDSTRQHIEE